MSQARRAGFRRLRGFGWCVALPVAIVFGVIAWLAFGTVQAGICAGTGVSMIGLSLLSLGYSLGDILGGYWMIPVVLAGLDTALAFSVLGGAWFSVLVATAVLVLMVALAAAIRRTSEGEGGLGQLFSCFVQSLIPGRYPR